MGCRAHRNKNDLLRIVRNNHGCVIFDEHQKISGRGVYICPDSACLDLAVKKKSLNRALGCAVGDEIINTLRKYLEA